jgi:hypothetical protein
VSGVTEEEVAFATCIIADQQSDGIGRYGRLKREVPNYVTLSASDVARSKTRRREPTWEQKIRNIKSHYEDEGNYIYEGYLSHIPRIGYRITDKGRNLLRSRGR